MANDDFYYRLLATEPAVPGDVYCYKNDCWTRPENKSDWGSLKPGEMLRDGDHRVLTDGKTIAPTGFAGTRISGCDHMYIRKCAKMHDDDIECEARYNSTSLRDCPSVTTKTTVRKTFTFCIGEEGLQSQDIQKLLNKVPDGYKCLDVSIDGQVVTMEFCAEFDV